jgi:RNA polymerase sigma-32 factor
MARDGDPNLSRFISMVREIPVLSREEEHSLALQVRGENDTHAAERLIRANLRYVVAIAVTFRRYDLRLSDLISEGNVGLVTAVRKFDPDAGTRFVTYAAYWIRAFILNHVIRSWSMVGSGSGALRSKVFFRLRRERAKMGASPEEADAARAELAQQLGTTPERVAEMMQRLDGRDVSLDADVYGDGKTSAVDMLEDDTAPQDERLDAAVRERAVSGRVHHALASLDKRERYIVEQRMMADEELSLAEIGRRLGVSRERARQLEARAKKKLRKTLAELETAEAA